MHHDTFAWVRLFLLIILILSFALFCSCAETRYKTEQPEPDDPVRKEPIYIAHAETPQASPLKAEAATEPTISKPLEETTPATEATEPPTAPQETEPPTETTPPETEPPSATEPAVEPTTEPTEATDPTEPEPTEEWRSLGTYTLTAYCSCQKCCGQYALNRPIDENGNPIVYTSIGAIAKAGVTIAVDPSVIPYGTEVKINDRIYIAQDTGGNIKGARIDVYFDDHQEALHFGSQTAEVFIRA